MILNGDHTAQLARSMAVVIGADPLSHEAARALVEVGVGRVGLLTPMDRALALVPELRALNASVRVLHNNWPDNGDAWTETLRGATVAVRSGFDDDAMIRAAVRIGLPVVAARGRGSRVDVIALRHQGPCPHQPLDIPARSAEPSDGGPSTLMAAALAAAEAVEIILGRREPRACHIAMTLGEEITRTTIPWAPECFACGGAGAEMVFP